MPKKPRLWAFITVLSLVAIGFVWWGVGSVRSGGVHPAASPDETPSAWTAMALWVAVACVLIGLLLLGLSHNWKHQVHAMPTANDSEKRRKSWYELGVDLLRDLGISFLVGAFVVATFELSLRRHELAEHERRQSAIQKDAVKYLLGYSIDPAVMDEVYNDVFKIKLMREEQDVTFQFHQADPKKETVRLRTSVSYKIKNVSSEEITYPLRHYINNCCPTADKRDQFTDFVVTFPSDLSSRNVHLGRPMFEVCDYQKEVVKEDDESVEVQVAKLCPDPKRELEVQITRYPNDFKQSIHLTKPITIPPGREVEISYASERTKRFADMVLLITTHPTKNFRVKAILCDSAVSHLQLEADAPHRLGPAKVSLADPDNRCTEWKFPTAVLPGQGFELHWYPKKEKPKEGDH